jgi:hypothetical protein
MLGEMVCVDVLQTISASKGGFLDNPANLEGVYCPSVVNAGTHVNATQHNYQ